MAVLSLPPARGVLSVMFLALAPLGLMADMDMGAPGRVALSLVMVLLGAPIWAWTLAGFWKDVSRPDHGDRSVVLAKRPRRLAVAVSWVALGVVVIAVPTFTISTRPEMPEELAIGSLLAVLVGLPTASLLPMLSRWYVIRGGTVSVERQGLVVRSPRQKPRGVRLWRLEDLGEEPRVLEAMPDGTGDGLAPGVRWRPGARDAVLRWAAEGFDPTFEEARALGLRGEWSSDPRASAETWRSKAGVILFLGWAVILCGLLAGGILYFVARGDSPWWILPVLGWAPVLGLAILGRRLLRVLRHTAQPGRPPARVTEEGWVDLLHEQGLIRWEHITHLMVRGHEVLLVATEDAPPFRDRDLGNRLNDRVEGWAERSRVPVPSAGLGVGGPGLWGVGERHLSYPPESNASAVADEAEALGRIPVQRVPSRG